ncbi:hypothetical protein FRC00_011734 [Tulasnella sp. 408]|nr:hypothetical protein FRC00_011734 [Tulasnella sp. 408]
MNGGDEKQDLLSERRGDPSAREILDALGPKYRIKLSAIKTLGDGQLYGRGGKGDIMLATLLPPEDASSVDTTTSENVAVKKIRPPDSNDQDRFLKAFANELGILSKLSHTNIVKLIGFVEDAENWVAWFVFPWEAHGNIREFILSGSWDIPERISLIFDTLSGIEYIHTRQPPICHGDLKSLNVLVNSNRRAVITDFGSARMLRESALDSGQSSDAMEGTEPSVTIDSMDVQLTLSGPAWSLRWAAPEVLYGGNPGLASDMWAFAWICWEASRIQIVYRTSNRD